MRLTNARGWLQGRSTTLHSYGVFTDQVSGDDKYVLALEEAVLLDAEAPYGTCITDDEGLGVSVSEGGRDGG